MHVVIQWKNGNCNTVHVMVYARVQNYNITSRDLFGTELSSCRRGQVGQTRLMSDSH